MSVIASANAASLADLQVLRDFLPVVGLVMVSLGMLMMYRKRRRHIMGNPHLTPQEHVERNRQAKGMQADLEALMVEIEQLAKRLGSQLDARTIEVERLIREADQRIALLRQLEEQGAAAPPPTGKRVAAAPPTTARAPSPHIPAPAVPDPGDPLAKAIYQLSDAGHNSLDIARKLDEHVGKVELILALREV